MTGAVYDFYYAAGPKDVPRAGGRAVISREANLRMGEMTLRSLTKDAPPPPEWAQDLLDVIVGAYLADRLAPRDDADDRWTRDIRLCLPVTDGSRWTDECRAVLAELLGIATGDRWCLEFRAFRRTPPEDSFPIDLPEGADRAEEVALFSGGLDSTSYAACLARNGVDALLVSYAAPKLMVPQDEVYSDIARLCTGPPLRRASRLLTAALPFKGKTGGRLEPSSRSRGLLFIATAVYLAAAYQAPRVAVPENGQLAINPPLSPARMSSASTRSVHPGVLERMNRLILLLGGDVEVVNPLEKLTKGQVCELGHKAGLPDEALFRTISCGSPLFQYDHARPQHCGYCVACLLRRSGLFAALGHDETEYEFTDVADFATLPENGKLNLAALARWSGTPYGVLDLLGDQPLPPTADLRALLDVVERGRAEIGRWLASLAG